MYGSSDTDLTSLLVRGDRAAAAALPAGPALRKEKNGILQALTDAHLRGELPFCQLTAAAQAAAALFDDRLPPVACSGAVAGNTSLTGQDYMLMLLRAWGVPTIDLGADVPAADFLAAVKRFRLRYVICEVFTGADLAAVRQIHEAAGAAGIREDFELLTAGAALPAEALKAMGIRCMAHQAAAVAEWVVDQWKP